MQHVKINKFLLTGVVIPLSSILCACGSGGGDSSPTAPSTPSAFEQDRSDSIKGIDADGSGVRDDIEQRISSYALSDDQKSLLVSYAKALSDSFGTPNIDDSINRAYNNIYKSIACADESIDDVEQYIFDIRALSINTKTRVDAYIEFESKLSGRSFVVPATSCNT